MFLNMGSEPPHDRGCRICGKIGHMAKNCTQARTCNFCKKTGHFVKNCPEKMQQRRRPKNGERNTQETFATNSGDPKNTRGNPVMNQGGDFLRKNSNPPDLYARISDDNRDRDTARKLLQMGLPAHRHPPPGFSQNYNSPPPGFQQKFPVFQNGTNFPPRGHPFPSHLYPRSKPLDELSQSPPKHYSSSPPKNYPRNNMYHKLPDHMSPMGVRSGLLPEPFMQHGDHRSWQNRQQMHPNSYSPKKRGKPEW